MTAPTTPSRSADSPRGADVLIVGAGPVGLSMAIALRHLGVGCVVVDKHESPMDFPRGRVSTLSAPWLVAADGAHSPTRTRLGIGRHGPGVVAHAVSMVIEADLRDRTEDRASVLYRITDLPGGTFLGMDNDRHSWGLIYEYDPGVDPAESFTEYKLSQLARTAIGDPEVGITITGHRFWESTALTADRFRHGRTFLVGDAAHVTTPIGGLGMNCGIGDVDNLSWKLAAVISGWASESLLDTYEAERRRVAELTVEASLGRARPPAPIEGLVLGASYASAAVVPDGTPPPEPEDPVGDYVPTARPGHRAPHLWLDEARTQSTLDLFGSRFSLLTTPAGVAWHTDARGGSAIPIRIHEIHHPDWPDLYGIGPLGAVLVRPDGYVAWRSTREPVVPNELADALSLIAGRARLKPD